MRRQWLLGICAAASLLGTANGAVAATGRAELLKHRERVADATVTVPAKGCAGAVIENDRYVLTAAHCVPERTDVLDVRFRDGSLGAGRVVHLDEDTDMALLELANAAPAPALLLSRTLPKSSSKLLFVGRVDRKSRTQVAAVTSIGTCPSLPAAPHTLFTTLRAKPGDSGAPLVDAAGHVVAIVHGGATCHIAASTADLAEQLDRGTLLPAPHDGPNSDHQAAAPRAQSPMNRGQLDAPKHTHPADEQAPLRTHRFGPFTYVRQPNGFRFEFKWDWRS